ncbi:hypothetical protein GGI21_000845, partial [Coemansia aciculifera]
MSQSDGNHSPADIRHFFDYPWRDLVKDLIIAFREQDVYSGEMLRALSCANCDSCLFPLARKIAFYVDLSAVSVDPLSSPIYDSDDSMGTDCSLGDSIVTDCSLDDAEETDDDSIDDAVVTDGCLGDSEAVGDILSDLEVADDGLGDSDKVGDRLGDVETSLFDFLGGENAIDTFVQWIRHIAPNVSEIRVSPGSWDPDNESIYFDILISQLFRL